MKNIIIKALFITMLLQSPIMAFDKGELITPLKNVISSKVLRYIPTDIKDIRRVAVGIVAESSAIPTAVKIISYTGVTASTGTSIATLSGAAATSATLASIGSTAVGTTISAAATAVGITMAPAVVGGVIVIGVASGVAYGINSLIDIW